MHFFQQIALFSLSSEEKQHGRWPFKQQQYRICSAGIQACGGFIQEQYRGVNDHFHANAGPFTFTSRDATNQLSAHLNEQKDYILNHKHAVYEGYKY